MGNTATDEDYKWGIIKPALEKAGVDVSKIKSAIQRRLVIKQAEADIMIGLDEHEWRDFAGMLIEEHPAWATTKYKRRQHAESLLNNWQSGVFGDPESEDTVDELIEGKYALVSWYDQQSIVHACGDTYRDICATIYGITYDTESPEHADFYVDLDTGEQFNLYTDPDPAMRVKTTIILELGGEVYNNQENN